VSEWTEPQLFDPGRPTHRKRRLGKAYVRLEVSITVEVDLDDHEAIERHAKQSDVSWTLTSPADLNWAIGNLGWVYADADPGNAIDWYVEDVDYVTLPNGMNAAEVFEEWTNPTYEPIGDQG
jgi:hypothetical protein